MKEYEKPEILIILVENDEILTGSLLWDDDGVYTEGNPYNEKL